MGSNNDGVKPETKLEVFRGDNALEKACYDDWRGVLQGFIDAKNLGKWLTAKQKVQAYTPSDQEKADAAAVLPWLRTKLQGTAKQHTEGKTDLMAVILKLDEKYNPQSRQARNQHFKKLLFENFDAKAAGQFPEDHFGNKWLLNAAQTKVGWAESYPVSSTEQCAEVLEKFAQEVGKMERVRSDNAPEFKGKKSKSMEENLC